MLKTTLDVKDLRVAFNYHKRCKNCQGLFNAVCELLLLNSVKVLAVNNTSTKIFHLL